MAGDELIIRAAHYAAEAHAGQLRKYTAKPYISHPARVAAHATLHPLACPEMVAAAWLHDVIEDCGVTRKKIENRFTPYVATIVAGMTNLPKNPGMSRAKRKAAECNRLRNERTFVKILKMIDRIDNLGEMDEAPENFRRVYLAESRALADAIGHADSVLCDELLAMINSKEVLDGCR